MYKKIYPRLLRPSYQSFFLFGARGIGKSTWLRENFKDAYYIDLLDERIYQDYLADPGLFPAELRPLPDGSWVVLDEVQRLPALLNEVHRAIETRGLKFVLCGSSVRKLKQAGTNLLAGRAVRRIMLPLVPEEMGDDFHLEEALTTGTIPVIVGAPDRADSLAAYTRLYLRAEIQAEALVRNLAGFARFLPVAALFHAQVLNVSSIARDAGVSRTTVAGYLEILEDTHLAWRLPAYEAKLRVRERRLPKFYWIDAGLVRALNRQFSPPVGDERGHLFEGLVANLLRAYGEYAGLFEEMAYWSPAEAKRTEVDFLLRRGREWLAIEVKSGATPDQRDLRGLRAVAGLEGMVRRILVFAGPRRFRTGDGIDLLGLDAFLHELRTGTLWP